MQHPHVLSSHHMYQFTRLDVSDLNEARLKGKNIGVVQCKTLWRAFPLYPPIRPSSPPIAINKKAEIRIIEEKLAIQPFDVNWLDVLSASNKVERGICLIEQ